MNALAPAPVLPQPIQSNIAVALRLADEGIPVRAIARATHISSSELYDLLRDALQAGTIIEIPKDDWPPGGTRSHRTIFNGTMLENEQALRCACSRFFKVSPHEAAILATMLKRNEVTKDQLHTVIEQNRPTQGKEETDPKMVDVLICKLRKKLKPHDIGIETMWGLGYAITSDGRDRAVALLVQHAGTTHG